MSGPAPAVDFPLPILYYSFVGIEPERMRAAIALLALCMSWAQPSALLSGQAEARTMGEQAIPLPDAVGAWRLTGPPRRIHAGNIFDYMDGGGELYLAYRFDHMLAYEYSDGGGNDILVELYRMKDSDDAFGLLSLDWGGEAVAWRPREPAAAAAAVVPSARALYGAGLLRLWSGDLYARVMAVRETPPAREAILRLGEAITAGGREPPPPALLRLLPPVLAPHWQVKPERTGYFRSHLVLNSLYYLSHENILGLDASCEAVFAAYEEERGASARKRIQLLLVRYPGEDRAGRSLDRFLAAYLPGRAKGATGPARRGNGFFQIEDGWLGFRLKGRLLVLAFGCPDLASARGIVEQAGLGPS
jgi:hypothetical protein